MKPKDSAKKQRIKEATLEIVHKNGLAGVKMSAVAKKAKLSPSNLYIYFKNKEDLLNNIFFDTISSMSKDVIQDNSVNQPLKIRIFSIYKTMIILKNQRKKEDSFFRQFIQSPYFKKEYHQKMDQVFENIINLFHQGQKEMILKSNVSIELFIAIMDGTAGKLIEMHNNGRITLDAERIEESFALVWDALKG